jgi:hypothetical protein
VKERNVIEAFNDFPLHLIDGCHAPCHPETEFCRTPILLNKIELAVILRVEVTQMATRLNQLLKLGFLRHKIGLQKEYPPATAVSAARRTVEIRALGEKVTVPLRPQSALPNDDLHAFEPAGHGGVVFREIK